MQRERGQIVRPHRTQCLMPQLGLRAGIGKYQAGALLHDLLQHARQLRQTKMARPGKALATVRQ